MHLPRRRGRNPDEQDKISAFIRKKIISGQWQAGYKIPTRLELGRKLGVTVVTLQKALSSLVADGFLRVQMTGRRGTYVNENSPHLYNYALVFPNAPSEPNWNLFFACQLKVSEMIQQKLGIRISPYFWLDGNPASHDYIRLINDIRKERLAGIVFASSVFAIEKTPVVLEGNIPRIVIGARNERVDIPWICFGKHDFLIKISLDYLESRNCRKVALILTPGLIGDYSKRLNVLLSERNFTSRPEWCHLCHLSYPETAVGIVRLLMSPLATERPDAIIVGDDNLLQAVCDGLKLAGIKVPEELTVISHCNFPRISANSFPVKFIGYDIYALMLKCIELLKQQRVVGKIPSKNVIEICKSEIETLPAVTTDSL